MFVLGNTYRRRELHKLYGGQRQGELVHPLPMISSYCSLESKGNDLAIKTAGPRRDYFSTLGKGKTGICFFFVVMQLFVIMSKMERICTFLNTWVKEE